MTNLTIADTTLRDMNQSLIGPRIGTEHMLPICEKSDKVGYYSLEMFGDATFDSMMRFLDEDSWEHVGSLREAMLWTKLQILLRAKNVVVQRTSLDDLEKTE